MPTTRSTRQYTQNLLTNLHRRERRRGERGGLWGGGEERPHPVPLPLRQGHHQQFTRPPGRPRVAQPPGPDGSGSRVKQYRPPDAPGPRPRAGSPSPGRCAGRPPPPQAWPESLSEPAGLLWAPSCGTRTRADSKGPALPATAPRKAAAAAAPPRAPAPRASPRPRRLAPVRERGASPYRQPAPPPDGQEGRQEEPTHRHPPASPAPGYRQGPRLRHPPRSPSFLLLLLRSDAAQPPPPARPSPTRPAPPRPPLHTLLLLPPRPAPPAQAGHSLGKKNRRSPGY